MTSEKRKKYDEKYRSENRDRIREMQREWYKNNAEKVKKRQRKLYSDNKERIRKRQIRKKKDDVDNLATTYVRCTLSSQAYSSGIKIKPSEFPDEVVELKRSVLRAKRLLKKTGKVNWISFLEEE